MALLLRKRSFHFYLYLFISQSAVHGVVNHESYGTAPHNTADVDENVDTQQMRLLFVCQLYWKVCQEQLQPSEQ